MEKQILAELAEIRKTLAQIAGTTHIPSSKQFSKEALDKAAKPFAKMNDSKDEWIKGYELGNYFEGGVDSLGKFIREEFGFSNYYEKGTSIYYNKKDFIALVEELKERNIDLPRYIKLRREQDTLAKKSLTQATKNRDKRLIEKSKKKPYTLPDLIYEVTVEDYNFPEIKVIEKDIEDLFNLFKKSKFENHINIYGDYAMIKYNPFKEAYLEREIPKGLRSWCDKFNKAQIALKIIKESIKTKHCLNKKPSQFARA